MEKKHNIFKIHKPVNGIELDINKKYNLSKIKFIEELIFVPLYTGILTYSAFNTFKMFMENPEQVEKSNYVYLAALGLLLGLETAALSKSLKTLSNNKKDMRFYKEVYEVLKASEDLYNEFGMPKNEILNALNTDFLNVTASRKTEYNSSKKFYDADETTLSLLRFSTLNNLNNFSNNNKKVNETLANHPAFKDWWNKKFEPVQQPEA